MFLPFELNEADHEFGTKMADPDLNYFNMFNQYVSNCNYFTESALNNELNRYHNKKQSFSLCHLNIRRMKKNVHLKIICIYWIMNSLFWVLLKLG